MPNRSNPINPGLPNESPRIHAPWNWLLEKNLEKFTVQKSYNRPGRVGILGLPAIRKVNNLRVINTRVETDPDQVHQVALWRQFTSCRARVPRNSMWAV